MAAYKVELPLVFWWVWQLIKSKLPLVHHTSRQLSFIRGSHASVSPSRDRRVAKNQILILSHQRHNKKTSFHLVQTMNVVEDFRKAFGRIVPSGNIVLLLLWHILHLILSVLYLAREILRTVESYLITYAFVKAYEDLNLDRVKYLGVVVDSDEARETSKVIELLEWLSAIGVKKVCLYDREGVLKKNKEVFVERFSSAKLSDENSKTDSPIRKNQMVFEFVSISDGKEAVAKAANLLLKKYYLDGDKEKPFFSEIYLTEALKTLGAQEPDPDLLLIYGPARCHLGFPAWRIRYTEMVHMGPLKYKKYGLIIKAIHKFTKVKQNYGS